MNAKELHNLLWNIKEGLILGLIMAKDNWVKVYKEYFNK